MTAQEMFEEIGYVKTDLLKYPSINYVSKKYETSISFNDCEKGRTIYIHETGDTYQDSGFIGIEEVKAINQQCKELGWIE